MKTRLNRISFVRYCVVIACVLAISIVGFGSDVLLLENRTHSLGTINKQVVWQLKSDASTDDSLLLQNVNRAIQEKWTPETVRTSRTLQPFSSFNSTINEIPSFPEFSGYAMMNLN